MPLELASPQGLPFLVTSFRIGGGAGTELGGGSGGEGGGEQDRGRLQRLQRLPRQPLARERDRPEEAGITPRSEAAAASETTLAGASEREGQSFGEETRGGGVGNAAGEQDSASHADGDTAEQWGEDGEYGGYDSADDDGVML